MSREAGEYLVPCCPCNTKVGDTFGLPPEPPVGAELKVRGDHSGKFRIRRDRDGWYIVGHAHTHISWRAAFSVWGPGSDPNVTWEVVRMP